MGLHLENPKAAEITQERDQLTLQCPEPVAELRGQIPDPMEPNTPGGNGGDPQGLLVQS